MWRIIDHRRVLIVLIFCASATGCAAIDRLTVELDPAKDRLEKCLDRDDWRLDSRWRPKQTSGLHRWRFGEQPDRLVSADRLRVQSPWEPLQTILDELSQDAAVDVESMLQALAQQKGRIGRNATIALARDKPSAADVKALRTIVREASDKEWNPLGSSQSDATSKTALVPLSTRAAAAEAWCLALAEHGEGTIEERLAEAGRLWNDPSLPDSIRAELLRGLTRSLPPERIVGYDQLFFVENTEVHADLRRAGIDGCLIYLAHHPTPSFESHCWPATLENAAFNADHYVRSGYAQWLALSRHPKAVAQLSGFLRDTDHRVWKAAVESLAIVKTDEALQALHTVAASPSELQRAAAVAALASWGLSEIKPYFRDRSPHVRRAAASALAYYPGPEAAILLDQALEDMDLETQHRAVAATRDWDDEFALPVLLSGLQNAAVKTRRECLDELRRRTGFDEAFPITGNDQDRRETLTEIAESLGWPIDGITRFRLETTRESASKPVPSDVATLLTEVLQPTIEADRRKELYDALRERGPEIVPAVETVCLNESGAGVEPLLLDVLPEVHPAHAELRNLRSEDVAIRRRAVGRLAEMGRSATHSPLVLRQLRELLKKEQDGLVWRQAMAAVSADATPEAEQIALMAINNTWPDVRRLGCEYVGRHRRAHQAHWLLPLMADPHDAVRSAAIDAIGCCGNASIIEERPGGGVASGLRAAAVDANPTIRLGALVSLSRLGDEAGSVALLRWAEFEPPSERIKAIRAIASTRRRRFEADLARLAWTETDDVIRRELLAALEVLVPEDQRPAGADAVRPEDRIAAWARRWEAAQTSSTMPRY